MSLSLHTIGAGRTFSGRPGRAYSIILLIYLAFVIYGSLVPLEFHYKPFAEAWEKFLNTPYLSLGVASRSDLVANLLLFVPLTFCAMGALTRENIRRGRRAIALGLIVAACMLSTTIEFIQIYFPSRTVSLNDLVAQFAGGVIGIIVWFLFGGRISNWARGLWLERVQHRLAVKILVGYVVFIVLYQLLPFDLTIRPAELYHKFKVGRITLLPFTDKGGLSLNTLGTKTAIMIPIGFLLAMLSRWREHPFRTAIIKGLLFAGAIEFLQLFVYSRYTSSTDVLFGTIGAGLGGWLSELFGPAARCPATETHFWARYGWRIKLTASIIWIGTLAWLKWQPFSFRWPAEGLLEHVGRMLRVPFFHQYYTSELEAAAQVVREFVNFLILGMLLRSLASLGRRYNRVVVSLLVVGIAFGLEAGQLFLQPRIPDITSIAIGSVGGVIGVWLYPLFVRVFVKSNSTKPEPGPTTEVPPGS